MLVQHGFTCKEASVSALDSLDCQIDFNRIRPQCQETLLKAQSFSAIHFPTLARKLPAVLQCRLRISPFHASKASATQEA